MLMLGVLICTAADSGDLLLLRRRAFAEGITGAVIKG